MKSNVNIPKTLPQDLEQSPFDQEIKKWPKKQKKIFNSLKYISVAIALFSLISFFVFDDTYILGKRFNIFGKISDLYNAIAFVCFAIYCHLQSKKYNLTDDKSENNMSDT